MKQVKFFTKSDQVEQAELEVINQKLAPEIRRISQSIGTEYSTRYASINAVSDIRTIESVSKLVKEKEALNPSALILVGIGGSNLGTLAILQALYGVEYQNAKRKIFCADTVDTQDMRELVDAVNGILERDENVLLVIVSKSGSTTETVSNAAILLELLKKHNPSDYHQSVVAITDHGSSLWYTAQAAHWSVLEIPALIGGRYSVFSAAGLFPLAMLGVNIHELQEGAHSMRELCVSENLEENYAAQSASILYAHYKKNIKIHDTFVFSSRLEACGRWYRQLMAESLGKTRSDGTRVGIMPTVSVGSTDLHSMAQLYLGGPQSRATTFIWVEDKGPALKIPAGPLTDENSRQSYLAGKSLDDIMQAIFKGTEKAFQEDKLAYVTLSLQVINEQTIAAFMQMKMIEIMYLAYLLEVNPFDQPDVEKYKKITHELLAS